MKVMVMFNGVCIMLRVGGFDLFYFFGYGVVDLSDIFDVKLLL